MDTDMEDVGRVPEPSRLSPATEPASIPTLDGWIESLMTCKQLAEVDVQRLCEKVGALGGVLTRREHVVLFVDEGLTTRS